MGFDSGRAWRLSPQVAIRPEGFGALAYHYGSRRLSFLKSSELRDLVLSIGDHPSAGEAIAAGGIPDGQRERYESALATLADSGMIVAAGRAS
ncbi:MAG: mycofactocin biosynthesis chaperone MftB [Solirubrobacterales bacterium]|nr:mycofactocin biosynthesis chaperone MftB [Solirubrobacterales bacterium]